MIHVIEKDELNRRDDYANMYREVTGTPLLTATACH